MSDHVISGVGESPRSRASGRTTLSLAVEACRRALDDSGLAPDTVDAVLSYQDLDSCSSHALAAALGLPSTTCVEMLGGGTCIETLVAQAMGLLELGLARNVLIFRSLNGRSGVRMGGGAGWAADDWMRLVPSGAFMVPFGMFAGAHRFAPLAVRHMHDTGLSEEALGAICTTFYGYAQLNPTALMHGRPLTSDDYRSAPYLTYPFRLHDHCVETDEANALVITTAERAADVACRSVVVRAVVPRRGVETAYHFARPDITEVAGTDVAQLLYARAGIDVDDVDIAAIYDCFSWVVARQLEAFGIVEPGNTDELLRKGGLAAGGRLPTNTAGGQLAEGYTHGLNNVIEMVRQLRGDHRGTARHVGGTTGLVTGWGGPGTASGMILGAPS